MAKQVIFADEARAKMKAGIEKVANAVKVTLGPKGRSVVLEKKFGSPLIIDDGVTIAKDIELEDKFERPTTSPATVPPPLRCWPMRCSKKGLKTSRPEPTRPWSKKALKWP